MLHKCFTYLFTYLLTYLLLYWIWCCSISYNISGLNTKEKSSSDDDDFISEISDHMMMFMMTVIIMLTLQRFFWRIMPFFLHDTVYLYLRAVNQTLAEGYTDYKDGRLIRSKTIGQRFVGRHSTTTVNYFNIFGLEELCLLAVLIE